MEVKDGEGLRELQVIAGAGSWLGLPGRREPGSGKGRV